MSTAAERTEIDRQIARILSAFNLDSVEGDTRWRVQLRDLRRILAGDYRGAVRALHRSGSLPVRSLLREARRDFPEFNVAPLKFDAALRARLSALGITLRLEEYAQRPPLRAFYHSDQRHSVIIWVNLAHPSGAVAASLGHELGHWYRERLLGSATAHTTVAFFNANFAAHLKRPAELFADLFVVLAAYPLPIAERIFPTGGWRQALATVARLNAATLARVRAHLNSNYEFDIHRRTDFTPPRRLYYVASMVHFARLRWAVLEEIGV